MADGNNTKLIAQILTPALKSLGKRILNAWRAWRERRAEKADSDGE